MGFPGLPEDTILRWALLAALALAALTLLAMVQVLALAQRGRRLQTRRTHLESLWRPWLAQAGAGMATGDPPELPSGRESLWLMLMFTRSLKALRGSGRQRMQAMGREVGLHALALATLHGRGTNHTLVALACLGELADGDDWAAVQTKLASGRRAIAMAAARVLVALDPVRAMSQLTPGMLAESRWSSGQLHELCVRAGPGAVTPVLRHMLESGTDLQRARTMSLLPLADPAALAPWARATLGASRGGTTPGALEAAEAALGVIHRLGDPRDRALVMPWLASRSPIARLKALQTLSRHSLPGDGGRFQIALGDRDWTVRQAAADALVHMPGSDPAELERRGETLNDPFARDALRRALAERSP